MLQNSLLQLLLALDAMPRPGHGLQPLGVDLVATGDALAEVTLPDSVQGAIHHLQKLAIIVALMKEEFLVVRVGSAIGDILRRIFVRRTTVYLISIHRATQFLLPRFQPFFEGF